MPQKDVASTDQVALQLAQKWRLDKYLDNDPRLAGKSDRKVATQKAVRAYVDSREAFPVNSVYTSISPTNPAEVLGYGTWSAVAAGQVLVGVSAGDPDFGTVGQAGGFKTITLQDHAPHTHDVTSNATTTPATVQSGAGATVVGTAANGTATSTNENHPLVHKDGRTGNLAIPILQPYVCVYFWLRTA